MTDLNEINERKAERCPLCGAMGKRIRRKFWMRLIPGSKYFECTECYHTFLSIWDRFNLNIVR